MAQTPSPLWKLQPTAQDQAWGLYATAIGSGADLPALPGAGWRLHFLVRGTAGLTLPGRRRLLLAVRRSREHDGKEGRYRERGSGMFSNWRHLILVES